MKTRFTFFFFAFTICTGTAITVKAQVAVQDSLALVDLYNNTNGPQWHNHTHWLNGPVSTWHGIALTDDNKRVRRIKLFNNNLEGSLPHSLGNLSALSFLDLGTNQINNNIPPELGNLTRLFSLSLSNNQLNGSLPTQLSNLTKLTNLDLTFNQLSGSIPPELGNLVNLQNLYLRSNQLSGTIPPELGNLTNLVYLDLDNNQLSGSIPTKLGNLLNLYRLFLSNNQLSENIPTELGNLINLNDLEISYNRLSGSIPSQLGKLTNLGELHLSNNQLNGSIPPELGNLVSLILLDLSNNQLSGNLPLELGKITNLYLLDLSNNQLSGSFPSELSIPYLEQLYLSYNLLSGSIPPEFGNHFPVLYFLHLDHNSLRGTIPSSIANMYNLDSLDLSHNQFTFDGMELIAETFPFAKYNNQAIVPVHLNGNALSVSAGGTLSNNTYTWYKEGGIKTKIIGDSVFHPTKSGVYAVRVQNRIANHLNLFSDTISYTVPIALNTFSPGNEQKNANNSFYVFPNPAKNVLNIHTGSSASFSLLDQSGKILLTKDITVSGSMNVSDITAGVYYLKNTNTGDVKKVVIAR
jgi:Leucine-rich repeat (LRR) protein